MSKCYYPDGEGGLIVGSHVVDRDGYCSVCGEKVVGNIKPTLFVVEKPRDEHGNTAYPLYVLEVEEEDERFYRVIAPEDFHKKWRSVKKSSFQQTLGPARAINDIEWQMLVHGDQV